MYLLVSGFRYKNAPLKIRERLSFLPEEYPLALNKLLEYPSIKEAVILSTCNRTEIYTLVDDTEIGTGSVIRFLADYHELDLSEIRKYMFTLMHEDTIRQIFKVTSGIDSMILGESQIVHQVKEAFSIAQKVKSIDLILTKLFKSSLTTSKRVRSETTLKSIITDVPSGAIELARKFSNNFETSKIAIIGAGNMAKLTIKSLIAKYEHKNIVVLNRTVKPVEVIYADFKQNTISLESIKEKLSSVDIIIVCTSASKYIIDKDHLPSNKSFTIVDIAVPRNVNPDIADLPKIKLFNIDDINSLIEKESKEKNIMLANAEKIVKEETEKFNNWMLTLDIIPTIKKVRDKIEHIRQNKLEKARLKSCPYSSERCEVLEELSKQLVNTILHDPTVRIKSTQSHEKIYQTAQLLNDMFNLDDYQS
ncbi:MAG: glutamyl-tRNA reductase [Cyanobacteriota bacterium]